MDFKSREYNFGRGKKVPGLNETDIEDACIGRRTKMEFTGVYPPFFSGCYPLRCTYCRSPLLRISHENFSILCELWFANLPIYLLYLVGDQSNVTWKIRLVLLSNNFVCVYVYVCMCEKKYNYCVVTLRSWCLIIIFAPLLRISLIINLKN